MSDNMTQYKEYAIVVEENSTKFIEECNQMLKDGWAPLGGCDTHSYHNTIFSQAFVR